MMPARKKASAVVHHETSIGKLLLVNVPGIITIIIAMSAFYATTKWRLDETDKFRAEEAIEHKTVQDKLGILKDSADAGRDRIRDEFFKRQDETNRTLSELDKKLAVSETKQQQMVDVLKGIDSTLQGLSLASGRSKK